MTIYEEFCAHKLTEIKLKKISTLLYNLTIFEFFNLRALLLDY